MPQVFINYRVEEQPAYATLLDRALSDRLGPEAVFLAARSLRAGDPFAEVVFDNLRRSSIVLAIIGPRWLDWPGIDGSPRLHAENDWVRQELSEAFGHGKRVIPVLVDDAPLPAAAALPDRLRALAGCQYLRLGHYTAARDLARIADEVVAVLGRVAPPSSEDDETLETRTRYYRLTGAPEHPSAIAVVPGSILRVRGIEAWVNSENTDLDMARTNDFSISGIVRYWGARRDAGGRILVDEIAAELNERVGDRRPVSPGTTIVTGAGSLHASHGVRHILHVAAVQGEPGAGFRPVRDIATCVENAMAAAESLGDGEKLAVLLPLLGAGSGGGDAEATARRILAAAIRHLRINPDSRLRTINLLAYTNRELALLTRLAAENRDLRPGS